MLAYFIVIPLIIGMGYLRDHCRKEQKQAADVILFLAMFLFMGIRYGIGQDYFYTYVPVFNTILETGTYSGSEVGFIFLNKLCQIFTDNYQSIFIVTSFILVLFAYKSILYNNTTILMSLYIFLCGGFYLYSFNVVRQCIVIATFAYAIWYIEERKFWKYAVLICLAATIHITALVYFPLYFIADRKLVRRFKLRTYIIMIVAYLLLRRYIPDILNVLFEGTKYANYLSGYWADTSKAFNVSQILNIFVFALYCFFVPAETNEVEADRNAIMYKNIHFIGLLFTFLTGLVPLIFRMTTMFYLLQFLSVPYLYENYIPKRYKNIALYMIIAIYGALFLNTVISNGNNIVPYQTFLCK